MKSKPDYEVSQNIHSVLVHNYYTSYVYQNTAAAVAKATSNDYVSNPHKLAENDATDVVPTASDEVHEDVFDPYASLGNLDPTDLVQFAWQIACGMVMHINSYLIL